MSRLILFEMEVEVDDVAELYEAALAKALEDGLDKENADTMLRPEGDIDASACVQYLADPGESFPGTSIIGSSAEERYDI